MSWASIPAGSSKWRQKGTSPVRPMEGLTDEQREKLLGQSSGGELFQDDEDINGVPPQVCHHSRGRSGYFRVHREFPVKYCNFISQLRAGDTVVVWKLDRLGRSLRDLIDLVSEFKERGVEFVSLQDGINTATPTGHFTFNIFASLAEFEREIIRERTKAGLASAKARGRKCGRPTGLSKAAMEKAKSARITL